MPCNVKIAIRLKLYNSFGELTIDPHYELTPSPIQTFFSQNLPF